MIKGLCTVSTGSVVNLLVDGELPEVGHYYYLESATEGTGAQNRTFHALTLEYFKSGHSSYDADNYADFKNMIKKHLGEGFDSFVYVEMIEDKHFDDWNEEVLDYRPIMKDAKSIDDIPPEIRKDHDMKDMIRGKLKSWSCYTKKQRKNCIDNVISEMIRCGINSPKFQEIMSGLDGGDK